MRTKYLLSAAVLGGLVEFAWGTVSHVALALPGTAAPSFADSNAVGQPVRSIAPERGLYFGGRGLLAAVPFRPDRNQKFESRARPLINQLLIEIGVAAV